MIEMEIGIELKMELKYVNFASLSSNVTTEFSRTMASKQENMMTMRG